MYDTAREEWEVLKQKLNPETDTLDSPDRINTAYADQRDDERGISQMHEIYSGVETADRDEPVSVKDCVSDREKLNLMHRFFIGVSVYITAAVIIFFLPLFIPNILEASLLILYDLLLFGFMMTLLYVFRMREGNQFILVGSDEDHTGPVMMTDLGVEMGPLK